MGLLSRMRAQFVCTHRTCSFLQSGVMFIIGGDDDQDYSRQISIVESCRLTKVGQLPYNFHKGACNNYKNDFGYEEAFLCFAWEYGNQCLT